MKNKRYTEEEIERLCELRKSKDIIQQGLNDGKMNIALGDIRISGMSGCITEFYNVNSSVKESIEEYICMKIEKLLKSIEEDINELGTYYE